MVYSLLWVMQDLYHQPYLCSRMYTALQCISRSWLFCHCGDSSRGRVLRIPQMGSSLNLLPLQGFLFGIRISIGFQGFYKGAIWVVL